MQIQNKRTNFICEYKLYQRNEIYFVQKMKLPTQFANSQNTHMNVYMFT